MRNIKAILASVEKLHGDTRDQTAKYDSFIAWQLRQRAAARGEQPSSIIRQSVDDPHDPVPTKSRWIAPDYSKPGTAEQVRKSVDEAYDAHWSIDKTRG